MPAAFRADLWAAVRIVDRAAATYIRGGVPLGIMVGVIMWLGLSAVERLGFSAFREAGPISVLAGAFQVIPEIGPLIGFLPALLILPISVERAVIYVVVTSPAAGWPRPSLGDAPQAAIACIRPSSCRRSSR